MRLFAGLGDAGCHPGRTRRSPKRTSKRGCAPWNSGEKTSPNTLNGTKTALLRR